MLIAVMALATALAVVWLLLFFRVDQEDWVTAAYNRVLDNRMEAERLHRQDLEKAEELKKYHGALRKAVELLNGGNSEKKIRKLEKESAQLQQGDLRSVNLLDLPGYVLQRSHTALGKGGVYKELLRKCTELYGRKYAVNKARQMLARLLSYPVIGVAASLALGALVYGGGNRNGGIAIIFVGTLLVLILTYAIYDEVGDRLNKRREAISRQFPNVVSKLALLVTSGMIMERAWRETAESQNMELYMEMRKTADELDNLVEPTAAYTNFINRCNTKETTKLASAIIQNQSKGNAEIGLLLKDMAHEAWQERRHTAKRDSEKANSKLMIPTMLLFIAILVMIMVPVVSNFSSL